MNFDQFWPIFWFILIRICCWSRTTDSCARESDDNDITVSDANKRHCVYAENNDDIRDPTAEMRHGSNEDDHEEETEDWTFPLLKSKGMTEKRYYELLARAQDQSQKREYATIISGFTCIGKTTFGIRYPEYHSKDGVPHRVINLEYNQYSLISDQNSEVNKAYLNDTLIAARFIRNAIIVVNCRMVYRQELRHHGLNYVRVHPKFSDPAVQDAWRARAAGRGFNRSPKTNEHEQAALIEKAHVFADRLMTQWDVWSELGGGLTESSKGFDHLSSPYVEFGVDDYLCTRVEDILEAAKAKADNGLEVTPVR